MLMSARCWPVPAGMEQLVLTFTVAILAAVFMAGRDVIVPSTQTTALRQMKTPSASITEPASIEWGDMTAYVLQTIQVNFGETLQCRKLCFLLLLLHYYVILPYRRIEGAKY